jgi:hypothetical protein
VGDELEQDAARSVFDQQRTTGEDNTSGAAQRLQSARGALPNIAPPSRRWLFPRTLLAFNMAAPQF